jgi:hypothetical protein
MGYLKKSFGHHCKPFNSEHFRNLFLFIKIRIFASFLSGFLLEITTDFYFMMKTNDVIYQNIHKKKYFKGISERL